MGLGSGSSKVLSSSGSIRYLPQVNIDVNSSNIISSNTLSLGFQLAYGSLGIFQGYSELRQLAKDAQFKIIRFFDGLISPSIPSMMPCTYFDEATKAGTYNWTSVDDVVSKILLIGAEPLVCLGVFPTGGGAPRIPSGMIINSTTGLPNPESYAAYATEWVKHFKAKGWNVRFYEILNEPWVYFGSFPDTVKLDHYMRLFAVSRSRMKQENPNVIVSFDFIHKKPVLEYWLAHNGSDVDSLNFHKYDDWKLPPQYTEEEMLTAAERLGNWYSIVEAAQVWYQYRGKHLPMVCSESNFNGASPITDPRIQQMTGAVWQALLLRTEILARVSYHVYYELSSSYVSNSYGFGMINFVGFKPWYPYFVQRMISNNLDVGDPIVESTSSSNDIRSLAWIHHETLNLLLICRTNESQTVNLVGLTGQLDFYKIDNTIPWENASLQEGRLNAMDAIELNGYTVMLLLTSSAP